MKFIVDIHAEIQSGYIQEFSSLIFQENFSVNSFQLKSRDEYNETYAINLIYSDNNKYKKTISEIENDPRCISIQSTNILENNIQNGLLKTSSRLSLENEDEFQTNHIGAYQLLKDKILSDIDDTSFYFHDSICSISGIKPVNNVVDKTRAELLFLKNEKDGLIVSRFTDINAFPLVVSYVYNEDLTKILKNLENSFSLYRINELADDDDPDMYIEIMEKSDIPLVSYKTTELPIMYLHSVFHCMSKYKMKQENTTIGIIGLDSSAVFATSLFNSLDFMKVLGYDENEKSMMLFESKKGLATTRKNILENCDILFLFRDQLTEEDLQSIRPGILVISNLSNAVSEKLKNHKSCKYFLDITLYDTAVLLPGIIRGLMTTTMMSLDTDVIIQIAELLKKKGNQLRIEPQLFSSIHDDIEDIIVSHSMR